LVDEPNAQMRRTFWAKSKPSQQREETFFPFSCQTSVCISAKFLGDLLKALVADHSSDQARRSRYTRGAQDVRLQSDELFPKMIRSSERKQSGGLGTRIASPHPLLKEVVRRSFQRTM